MVEDETKSQSSTDEIENETKSQPPTEEVKNETTFQPPTDEVEPKEEDVVNATTQPEANDNDNTSDTTDFNLQTVHTSTPQAEVCFSFRFFIYYINIFL